MPLSANCIFSFSRSFQITTTGCLRRKEAMLHIPRQGNVDPVPSVDDSFLHLVRTTVTVCDSLVLHLELLIIVYDATGLLCSIPNIVSSTVLCTTSQSE